MIGAIKDFDVRPFIQSAEQLMRADEAERALRLLDNLPAYYRDNPPAEVRALREAILSSLLTPHAYATVDFDSQVGRDILDLVSRGLWVKETLSEIEALLSGDRDRATDPPLSKATPAHVCEMGPGEYWLPLGLAKRGFDFTYHDLSLLQRTGGHARQLQSGVKFVSSAPRGAKRIFVAFEIIEHLADPLEIAIEAARHCAEPDYVFLSTPLYTFDEKVDWRKPNGQPHLRAYTPQEFFNTASKIFPGYNWEMRNDQIMVLRGMRRGI